MSMHDRSSTTRRPRALDRRAVNTVEAVTNGERALDAPARVKNPHAAALGSLGGKKGGPARALKLTSVQRSEIARKAAASRWHSGRTGS